MSSFLLHSSPAFADGPHGLHSLVSAASVILDNCKMLFGFCEILIDIVRSLHAITVVYQDKATKRPGNVYNRSCED